MTLPLFQVDAFTDRPFSGNPAAVCLLFRPQPDAWMQAVAAEMNLSETAFLVEESEGYRLRWFTPKIEVRGVVVTAPSSSPEYDFVSRFFAPRAGINEDPVTGSAHCCLGAYWQTRPGKSEFTAYQASARGGVVQLRVSGDRAHLGGRAVIVLRGELVA